jgi:predicted MFS family arabinose efflux permease
MHMHLWRALDPQRRLRLISAALMPGSLVWLAAGAFATATESYVIAGILPVIASDLGVSVAAAGQLVTFHAITLALGSLFRPC